MDILSNLFKWTMIVFVAASCSKQSKPKEEVWSKGTGGQMPSSLNSEQFKKKVFLMNSSRESIERSSQMVGRAVIENSFLQKVKTASGDLLYVKSVSHDGDLSNFEKKSEKMYVDRFAFVQSFRKSELELLKANKIFPPRIKLLLNQGPPTLVYEIDYVDYNQTAVHRLQVTPDEQILTKTQVSSGFEDGKGTVFPFGPKTSELKEVVFANLLGDGTLSKNSLKMTPQVSEKAQNPNLVFNYEPQDVRFDQVQSFFYIDQALRFFQNRLDTTLPFALELQTHVGAPEKTNAMFYYPGQIRLGTGDGVNYNNIMKDPSIVFHETCHALVDALSNLPLGQGEGGSLNEAFADFFTAVFLSNPNMGEVAYMKGPYKRTLKNEKTLKEKNGGLYNDSLIVSGLFWDIKTALGDSQSLLLATKTLTRLGPNGQYASLPAAIIYSMETQFSDQEKNVVLDLIRKRGWQL